MKKVLVSLSLVSLVAGLGSHTVAAPAPKARAKPTDSRDSKKAAPRSKGETAAEHAARLKLSAPADEYFGRQKMSFIGINNTLRDETIRSGDYTTDSDVIHKVGTAEDALNDWQRKYPHDPQLARTLFLIGKSYAKIWTAEGQNKAATYYLELDHQFPGTYFGKLLHGQLAKGFTEHILADPLPCPASLPTDTPTPLPLRRGQTPSPSPSPSPMETPTPSPTPYATPTPPKDPRVHISIVPQSCYTPTPSPSPSPSPLLTASPTGAPSAPSSTPLPSGRMTPVPSASPASAVSPVPAKTPFQ